MGVDIEIGGSLEGQRVDRIVAMALDVSRSVAAELIDSGAVNIDGRRVAKGSERAELGQTLALPDRPEPIVLAPDDDVDLHLVHVDDDVIVIDKVAGMVVHPGAGVSDGTLVQGLLARFPEIAAVGDPARPGIVHRLDRGTSGLLVAARSERAHDALTAQLAGREVHREYRALVHGNPSSDEGLIDAPIGRSLRHPTRQAVRPDGKEARSYYRVEERFEAVALLSFELETGRTHQIRVHADAIGHPIVGDDRYGRRRSDEPLDRPFLHAVRLEFEHPGSGETVHFTSPLAPDLQAVLADLRH